MLALSSQGQQGSAEKAGFCKQDLAGSCACNSICASSGMTPVLVNASWLQPYGDWAGGKGKPFAH